MPSWKEKIILKDNTKKGQRIVSNNTGRVIKTVLNFKGVTTDNIQEKGATFFHKLANNFIGYDMEEAQTVLNSALQNVYNAKVSGSLEEKLQRFSQVSGFTLTPDELKSKFSEKFVDTKKPYKLSNKEIRDDIFPKALNALYQETLKKIYNNKSMQSFPNQNTKTAYNKICGTAMLLGSCIEQFAIDVSNDPSCNHFLSRPTTFMPPQKEEDNQYKRSGFSSREYVMKAVQEQCKHIKLQPGEQKPDYSAMFSTYENTHSLDHSLEREGDYWVKTENNRLYPSLLSHIKKQYIQLGALKACDYIAENYLNLGSIVDNVLDATHRSHSIKKSVITNTLKEKMANTADQRLSFSPELLNKLKDSYGFNSTAEQLNERFIQIIEQNKDLTVATNETWSKTILPKNLKDLFHDLKKEILPKAAEKGNNLKESKQKVEEAINDIGNLIENYSETLANYADVDFFEKPLCILPDPEESAMFKRQNLTNNKEIERLKSTYASLQHSKINNKNSALVNYINNNLRTEIELPDGANGIKKIPYVYGEHPVEDQSRFLDNAYKVRDAIKEHEGRGFFYKLFRRSKYKQEKLEIEAATTLLKDTYEPELVDQFLNIKDKSMDISSELRLGCGANKNAEQIAKEIEAKAEKEKELYKLEDELSQSNQNVKDTLSKDTAELITQEKNEQKRVQDELDKLDDLYALLHSVKLDSEKENVAPKIEPQANEVQEQANPSVIDEKPQDPANDESKEAWSMGSAFSSALSMVTNGIKTTVGAVKDATVAVTSKVVDGVSYAGKTAYNIAESGYRTATNLPGYFFSWAKD